MASKEEETNAAKEAGKGKADAEKDPRQAKNLDEEEEEEAQKKKKFVDPEIEKEKLLKALKKAAIKTFFFRIDKIKVTFEKKIDQVFLEFNIGGKYKTELTEAAKGKPKKKKDKDGKEITVMEVAFNKHITILKTRARSWYSHGLKNIKPKAETLCAYDDAFSGYWVGTYKDLHQESVTVKVWKKMWYGANVLIGSRSEKLIDIARTKMHRNLNVLKSGAGRGRKEMVCVVRFKCEFQENFNYDILFKDWVITPTGTYTMKPQNIIKYFYDKFVGKDLKFQVGHERNSWSILDTIRVWSLGLSTGQWEDRCKLTLSKAHKTGSYHSSATGKLSYKGTRAWLEDEALSITYSQVYCAPVGWLFMWWPCRFAISESSVDLQGVLDYGYIMDTFSVVKTQNPITKLINPDVRAYGVKGVLAFDGAVRLPQYRQLGNVDPEAAKGPMFIKNLPKLKSTGKGTTFLVIRIVRAKGLFSVDTAEYKESLNPNVTVEWSAIKKTTRTILNSNAPYWGDEVYFKIPDERNRARGKCPKKFDDFNLFTQKSKVTIGIWDNFLNSKAALGYVEVDFKEMFFKREKKHIVSFASSGHEKELWVYEDKLPLKTPFVSNSAVVPSTDEKGKETMEKKLESDTEQRRYVEFLIYLERTDGKAINMRAKRKKAKKKKLFAQLLEKRMAIQAGNMATIKPLNEHTVARAENYWQQTLKHVQDRHRRFFPFYGKDDYSGNFHFLPTFLKPISPPIEIKEFHNLLYFVYSIECTSKPLLKLNQDDPSPREVWSWGDPFFLLEKRKGDLKDHALLLCDFLLGSDDTDMRTHKAYVCIGTALAKGKKKPEPHIWVMTKEIVKVKVPESEEDSKNPAKKLGDLFGSAEKFEESKVVRFWECSDGQVYSLSHPSLFDDLNDEEKADYVFEDSEEEKDEVVDTLTKKQKKKLEKQEAARRKKIEKEEEKRRDLEIKKAFEQFDPEADDDGEVTPSVELSEESEDEGGLEDDVDFYEEEEEEERKEGDEAGNDDLSLLNMSLAAPVAKKSGAGHSLEDEKRIAGLEADRKVSAHARELMETLTVPELEKEKRYERKTPYKTLDLVFNHQNLWCNLQKPNPEVIKYNFNDPKRWGSFGKKNMKEFFEIDDCQPFYPSKALVSIKAAEGDTLNLQKQIFSRVKDSVVTFRSYVIHSETVFLDQFPHQKGKKADAEKFIQLRFDWEFENGGGLRSEELVEMAPKQKKKNGEEDAKFEHNVQDWIGTITDGLPQKYLFQERLFHFKHSNPNIIADTIMKRAKGFLKIPEKQDPQYALSVKIHRLPMHICPVRVYFCVIYKGSGKTKAE